MQSVCAIGSWYAKPAGVNSVQEKVVFNNVRAAPATEIPRMGILKRKRTESVSEVDQSVFAPSTKKQRVGEAQEHPEAMAGAHLPDQRKDLNVPASLLDTGAVAPAAQDFAHDSLVLPSKLDTHPICQETTLSRPSCGTPTSHLTHTNESEIGHTQSSIACAMPSLTSLQQVIENEFNLQTLMKHDELRLIEQELAKCQVALEQLRRCELRSYPGTNGPEETVTSGTGASIAPPTGYTRPVYPAPYGVEDGPYTQPYSQWLIQGPQFTSSPVHAVGIDAGLGGNGAHTASRSTRNSGARKSTLKTTGQMANPSQSLSSLPNYPSAPPRDKSQPLIIRRSTDNQYVKLVCNNCQRGNFSSIQGFLNHCRIAHKVDYKSHDAAAIDCGRLLEEHEAADLPPQAISTSAHKPQSHVKRPSLVVSTPTRNSVHPLNKSNAAPLQSNSHPDDATQRVPVPNLNSTNSSMPKQTFTPSPHVPRLSAHFAKHQLGGDLAKATASAREKIDLGTDDELPSPDVMEFSSPLASTAGTRTVAGAGRPGMLAAPGIFARPPSRKGHRQPAGQKPRPSPLASASLHSSTNQDPQHHHHHHHQHNEIPESPHDRASNLSPHSHTADSNPGLVSDHEDDDDHGSASEDEAPQATMAPILAPIRARRCSENMDIDVAVEDDLDQHGLIIRRNSMFAEDEQAMRTSGSSSKQLAHGK